MNKTLNLQCDGIFGIIWRHIKVFTKCFQGKSVRPVIWWADFPWNRFAKTLMWRHIMQNIPSHCKFNVLFIWLKIAAVSVWNFKFQISCFLCLKTSEVLYIYTVVVLILYNYTRDLNGKSSSLISHITKSVTDLRYK